jgi:NAD+ synthase
MTLAQPLDFSVLDLDPDAEVRKITEWLRHAVTRVLNRRGAVVGISGGIDSAVTTALCARALGPERVVGLLMPDRHSSDDTLPLSRAVAESQGVATVLEDITELLDAAGCYTRQQEAVRMAIPEFGAGDRFKIVLPSVTDQDGYRLFSVVAVSADGTETKRRLPLKAYLSVVAATNFKQRTRKMLEYFHADRLNFAVAGTPNRLEYDQGFFVKGGDGLADFKPIAHLYKSQVYALAAHLDVPEDVRSRPPTTDTYSLPQGQDEFYFSLPYRKMDLCLYAKNHGYPPEAVAAAVELSPEQVDRVYRDIDGKRSTTRYLHLASLLVEPVAELRDPACIR